MSNALKDTILEVSERLGRTQRFSDPENERAFRVPIAPKLLPMELAGNKDNPVQGVVTVVWQPPVENYRVLDEQTTYRSARAERVA
jgi:hypothetical protein